MAKPEASKGSTFHMLVLTDNLPSNKYLLWYADVCCYDLFFMDF